MLKNVTVDKRTKNENNKRVQTFSVFDDEIVLKNGKISVRRDKYSHGYFFVCNQIEKKATKENGIFITENSRIYGNLVKTKIEIEIKKEIEIEKLYMRTGIDTYMEKYPDWNEVYFPTMLYADATQFIGYFQKPNGAILGIASPNKIESWSVDYCRATYEKQNHVGHRIYTVNLHFFNCEKKYLEEGKRRRLKVGDKYTFTIYYKILHCRADLKQFWKTYAHADVIESKKWTYEKGEKAEITCEGKLKVFSPSGEEYDINRPFTECGVYQVESLNGERKTTAKISVREEVGKYLPFAAKWAMKCEPRPSTHAETYYGYFSMFAYIKSSKNKQFSDIVEEDFNNFCAVILTEDERTLKKDALPERVQNIGTMISLFVAAYNATGKSKYLDKAIKLAYTLESEQSESGEYIGFGRVYYTCVVYPAKNMLELYDALKKNGSYQEECENIYNSAYRAIYDLSERMDNIQTEGQQTFEDGMISCAALQLGMLALRNEKNKANFTNCAEKLIKKHECLEQKEIPDGRMKDCTLRFWESMYDVLIPTNMFNSPHGWTSWKIYADYYLYLLTLKENYLTDMFDALGACLQCFDLKNDRLYWAFIVDPEIKAKVFSYTSEIKREDRVFGTTYLPVISDCWKSDRKKICFGYALFDEGLTDGIYKGGCCDNDVHEHIKCLDEVGLNAYVHERKNGEFLCYNCLLDGDKIILKSEYLKNLYIRLLVKEKTFFLQDKKIGFSRGLNTIPLNM